MATNFNTTVKVYSNVPLLPDYNDTMYFYNRTEQQNWFEQFCVHTFGGNSYQRVGRNKIRLQGNPERYHQINYCSFVNLGNQADAPSLDSIITFYAFVTAIEYINDNVFEITYEVDVMQTWMFHYLLLDCFVEREHSQTDAVGDNLVKEPITIGDHITQQSYVPYRVENHVRVNKPLTENYLLWAYVPSDIQSDPISVTVGSARSDMGDPQPGDQSGDECSLQAWYRDTSHGGWKLLRANNPDDGQRLAYAMLALCNNNYIGYEFSPGANYSPTLLSLGPDAGWWPAAIRQNCVTNCSQAVYFCCKFTDINPASVFTTFNEYDVLMATGKFTGITDRTYTSNMNNMRLGDILVCNDGTAGHTVIVVNVQYPPT